jgi:predicted nucleotidyltransferase
VLDSVLREKQIRYLLAGGNAREILLVNVYGLGLDALYDEHAAVMEAHGFDDRRAAAQVLGERVALRLDPRLRELIGCELAPGARDKLLVNMVRGQRAIDFDAADARRHVQHAHDAIVGSGILRRATRPAIRAGSPGALRIMRTTCARGDQGYNAGKGNELDLHGPC